LSAHSETCDTLAPAERVDLDNEPEEIDLLHMLRRLKNQRDIGFDRMFDTRSEAWERVGLAMQTSHKAVRRARGEAAVLLPILIGVLIAYHEAKVGHLGIDRYSSWQTPIQIITVIALLILGWTFSRDIGKAAAPTFFRRMDPATAGTVGFVIRLATLGVTMEQARGLPWTELVAPPRAAASQCCAG